MPHSRIPGWMYFMAGAFLAYYAVLVYSELFQPGRTGIDYEFRDGIMFITGVAPQSPASRAGIKTGDRLRAVDGWAINRWEDWRRFRAIRELGRDYRFIVERDGRRAELQVTLGRQPGETLARLEPKRYVQFALLLLAFVLAFRRSGQRVAQIGAWLLAAIGTAPLFPEVEMTAVWRELPTLLGAVLWIPQLSHLMLFPLFFTFFALVPRRLFRASWPWAVIWTPAVIIAAGWIPHLYNHIYRPPIQAELPAWLRFVLGAAVLLYGGGGLAALWLNYRRLTEFQDRQRVRVLVAGAFIGLSPIIPFLAAIFWGTLTQSPLVWFFVSDPYRHSLVGIFLAFPISLAYALVRHRVLDMQAGPSG